MSDLVGVDDPFADETDAFTDSDTSGEDVDRGQLFEVPRLKIDADPADPDVLVVTFTGKVELDRGNDKQVAFYNSLRAGDEAFMGVHGNVAYTTTRHKRYRDGNPDDVVQSKALFVTDVYFEGGDDD